MFTIFGVIVILVVVFLLVKQYETRMVLFVAGVVMAIVSGKPMVALDAFATTMTNGGLIQAICSVMGFAYVMKVTQCDKHLILLMAKFLKNVRPILIPGAVLCTCAINVALPSAAGVAAAVGAIFIPVLTSSGVHPATAGAAVFSGTFGSLMNPGLAHNPFVAKIAGVTPMDVIKVHAPADIIGAIIAAISLTIVAKILKEDKGYVPDTQVATTCNEEQPKINILYAVIPIIPIALLVLGAMDVVPALKKMGVPQAMLIGAILGVLITRSKPTEVTKSFFEGMGFAYAQMMGIIIAAGVFVSGMITLGLVDAFVKMMVDSADIAKYAATFGPFILGIIAGSGDAAAFAFNESVTPHAMDFGMSIINMGSLATVGGALGRSMSPIAGAAIICASLAGVSSMDLAKRNALGMFLALLATMCILT